PPRWNFPQTVKLDVRETDKQYIIEAELPGVSKEELVLDLNGELLTIAVNKRESVNDENGNYIHRERRSGSMSRSLRLVNCKRDGIKARLDGGILVVAVDKGERADISRRIEIES
ncbi:MAG: Hsp20/alpha crystallin family protein, partial [Clostridiales bacterium]|nr:Hsp20/alpha crystallin family protein [Clostridiales bacterium]